jgi:CMP/dCMP kinase
MDEFNQTKYPEIIAIDGPAASGKSTLGEKIAQYLGYLYFDTGIMYRATTLAVLKSGIPFENEALVTSLAEKIQIEVFTPTRSDGRLNDVILDGVDVTWEIRSPEVENRVSLVSSYPGVRKAMTEQQRKIGKRGKTIMVGRDIGTVVFPEAEMKIYLDASVEERSRRRFAETNARGDGTSLEDISSSMLKRDKIDSTRIVAPLKPAEDALIIHTDNMDEEEVYKTVLKLLGINI